MAIALLDGTTAAFGFLLATVEQKCHFGYMSFAIAREMFEATTFCSSGWRSRRPGMKQMLFSLAGYLSTGAVYSDPLAAMASTTALAIVVTIHTGCTLTFNGHITGDGGGMRAAGMSDRVMSGESDGVVTSAWVTS